MIRMFYACEGRTNGIGINNSIPWKCSLDMQMYMKVLKESDISVCGPNTWENLPPNAKRLNIPVVINNRKGSKQYPLLSNVINTDCNVLISGGSSIYKFCAEHGIADEIIVNRIIFHDKKYLKSDFDTFGLSFDEISKHYSLSKTVEFSEKDYIIFQEIYTKRK